MWTPDKTKRIKIRLHDHGEDNETPWAEDLGPAPGAPPGARRARIGNVVLLNSKPTYEDVVVVVPDEHGMLSWCLGDPIDEDGGRWAMILEYRPKDPEQAGQHAFSALDLAAQAAGIVAEGAYGPTQEHPGLAYLAVPAALSFAEAMAALDGERLALTLTVLYPDEDDDSGP